MKKRMTSLVLALAMCLSLCTTVFAEDATHEITEENYTQVGQFTFDNPIIRCIQLGEIAKPGTEEDTVNGGQFGGVYYRKTRPQSFPPSPKPVPKQPPAIRETKFLYRKDARLPEEEFQPIERKQLVRKLAELMRGLGLKYQRVLHLSWDIHLMFRRA